MEYRRTLALLIIVTSVLFAGFVAGSPEYDGNRSNTQPSKQTPVTYSLNSENSPSNQANETNYYSPHWYTALKRPDWLLVMVGTVTFIVIGWQSWETKQAAKAAAASVDAMNKQVKIAESALILNERPRIIVRNFYFSDVRGTHPIPVGVEIGSAMAGQFYAVNCGGTNAHIIEWKSQITISTILPMQRPYEGQVGSPESRTIAPGGSHPYLFSRATEPLTAEELRLLAIDMRVLYVLGWIGYFDDLDIYRRMAFCRRYDFGLKRFIPVDNPDYEHSD